ncbi:MAG TPA: 50S ribosomal protein L15 [Thermomicrobiaceae bacterium]|nr:50S ribosomal protein L15 [Thermomicrobiaceae bacterium]
MQLHDLKPAPGSRHAKTRVGRGIAAGKGKTAGRGTKGQGARGQVPPGFEGGQNPLYRRMPYKRGFVNIFRIVYEVVNVSRLGELDVDGPITPEVLYDRGITRGLEYPVKVLGDGELTRAITVHAHKFSKSARAKIEAAGGSAEVID